MRTMLLSLVLVWLLPAIHASVADLSFLQLGRLGQQDDVAEAVEVSVNVVSVTRTAVISPTERLTVVAATPMAAENSTDPATISPEPFTISTMLSIGGSGPAVPQDITDTSTDVNSLANLMTALSHDTSLALVQTTSALMGPINPEALQLSSGSSPISITPDSTHSAAIPVTSDATSMVMETMSMPIPQILPTTELSGVTPIPTTLSLPSPMPTVPSSSLSEDEWVGQISAILGALSSWYDDMPLQTQTTSRSTSEWETSSFPSLNPLDNTPSLTTTAPSVSSIPPVPQLVQNTTSLSLKSSFTLNFDLPTPSPSSSSSSLALQTASNPTDSSQLMPFGMFTSLMLGGLTGTHTETVTSLSPLSSQSLPSQAISTADTVPVSINLSDDLFNQAQTSSSHVKSQDSATSDILSIASVLPMISDALTTSTKAPETPAAATSNPTTGSESLSTVQNIPLPSDIQALTKSLSSERHSDLQIPVNSVSQPQSSMQTSQVAPIAGGLQPVTITETELSTVTQSVTVFFGVTQTVSVTPPPAQMVTTNDAVQNIASTQDTSPFGAASTAPVSGDPGSSLASAQPSPVSSSISSSIITSESTTPSAVGLFSSLMPPFSSAEMSMALPTTSMSTVVAGELLAAISNNSSDEFSMVTSALTDEASLAVQSATDIAGSFQTWAGPSSDTAPSSFSSYGSSQLTGSYEPTTTYTITETITKTITPTTETQGISFF